MQFFVRALKENAEQSLSNLEEAEKIGRIISMEGNERRGELRKELAIEFTELLRANGQVDVAKRLTNTSTERIFWETIRHANLEEIKKTKSL